MNIKCNKKLWKNVIVLSGTCEQWVHYLGHLCNLYLNSERCYLWCSEVSLHQNYEIIGPQVASLMDRRNWFQILNPHLINGYFTFEDENRSGCRSLWDTRWSNISSLSWNSDKYNFLTNFFYRNGALRPGLSCPIPMTIQIWKF